MDKLDILNRKEFVNQLIKLVEYISANKSSTCFAINGVWGCGKSFVLDMFENELEGIQSEKTNSDQYFIIRYNSWKYDYYEEPLVAIVASMISTIEEKTNLFPDSLAKSKYLGILKAIGVSLLSVGADAAKAKTGIDFKKAFDVIEKGKAEGTSIYEDEHEYDVYFGFKNVLNKLADLLRNIAEKYTIVILVDELDRCLPEYAIKVLERLHHLTENQSNIITIVSIDKEQLLTSVKQIFGFENPEKYLAKFISFEVKLDCGTVSETLMEKYSDYFALFDKEIFPFKDPVEECLQAIFKGIDIRTQEQLMNKAKLVHKLLYTDKKDYSFMCMEVLLAVMICFYQDDSCFTDASINLASFDNIFMPNWSSTQPAFAAFFKAKFEKINFNRKEREFNNRWNYVLPEYADLYGAILFTWYWMHKKNKNSIIKYNDNSVIHDLVSKNTEELKKYAEMIKMMS